MDTCDLFSSCRKGDVGRVRYLLEQRDVEVNVRDKWDSTPLYYACLCGHEELVLYLLAHGPPSRVSRELENLAVPELPREVCPSTPAGARCEANTFDGERCLYGAQSDAIRRALRDYRQVTASFWRRDLYYSFLLRLLEQGLHSDVVFVVHGRAFRAHRGVLGARSTYFAHMLDTKWKGRSAVVLRHPLINPVAFGALLQYLYTGCLDVGVEHVSDCERLARQCQLWGLLGGLEAKQASKPGVCMKVLTIEPPQADLQLREDLALLADCALPPELRGDLGELPFPCDGLSSCPDVCFRVGGYDFLCHKAFFCGRSEYFRALLDDHFQESEQLEASGGLPAVTLHSVSPEVFTHVLYYVYSDHTELPPELAYDVLSVADMYLLPGLKQLCGRSLAQLLDEDSVVGVWRVAKLFGLARLEDQCTKYMARVIEKLVQQEDFVEAVREEAAAVAGRQETDSIPLVDDIRFHMGSLVQTCHAMEQAAQRLRVLEELLVSIGLDC
ncbi:ankyrin repeat and BTB/POZ domain-containing protein 1 isoform X1 [Bos indicus x Bos taurus]|uniref:Ankyrin repeat and BTB domain containing 1 n=2 Tax=Bos TaxID=9903 RepID=F6R435_BOVIN|nr:ankyrin repeat and BTB/POZ domain-containing protein 1 isoform X1 [Bos taurus]XP_027379687.1 ankyrin repeat and BTB/POZ domain-containing protein 1 isoform X1 [Bos indicus x Bos taurus]